jgi:acetate---CoA ligase (ADP-forming)
MNVATNAIDSAPPVTGGDKLRALMDARTVAVIGASADPRKLGSRPSALLQKHGFAGRIFPVNPRHREIGGLAAYRSLAEIPEPVDLALVLTSAADTLGALEEGLACGVRNYVLFASGFSEQDEDGRLRQDAITRLARDKSLNILGPNCVGLMNVQTRLCATIASVGEVMSFTPAPFSFVSQSGAIGGYWLDMALRAGLGFSKWITSGNEAGIDMADCVEHLARDPGTEVIGLYLEAVRDSFRLRAALASAVASGKPVLALRSGRSAAGRDAVASHTAGLAGDAEICSAFLAQCGVQQVGSLSEMVDTAKLLLWGPGGRVAAPAIVSVSGGAGALVTDAVSDIGLALPLLGPLAAAAVTDALPSFGKASNPLDLTGAVGADPSLLGKVLQPIASEGLHDLLIVFVGLMHGTAAGLVQALIETAGTSSRRLAVIWMCAPQHAVQALQEHRIPVFSDIPDLTDALRIANGVRSAQQRLSLRPPATVASRASRNTGTSVSEHEAHVVLGPVEGLRLPREALVRSAADVPGTLGSLRLPLAAKLQSRALQHKTEHGAVLLKLANATAVSAAVDHLEHIATRLGIESEGVLLQEMVEHELEMIIGLRWDPVFGPVLLLGRGGTEVEAERDTALLVLPASADDIAVAIRSLRMAARLQGSRGRPAVDIEALATAVHGLCVQYIARDDIAEIEINPLAVEAPAKFTALDMLLRRSA